MGVSDQDIGQLVLATVDYTGMRAAQNDDYSRRFVQDCITYIRGERPYSFEGRMLYHMHVFVKGDASASDESARRGQPERLHWRLRVASLATTASSSFIAMPALLAGDHGTYVAAGLAGVSVLAMLGRYLAGVHARRKAGRTLEYAMAHVDHVASVMVQQKAAMANRLLTWGFFA